MIFHYYFSLEYSTWYKNSNGNIQKINEKNEKYIFIISCKNDIIAHKNEFVNTIFRATCEKIILYSFCL
jgi:hypothetical protein